MKKLKLVMITALLACMAVCTPAFANDWSIEVNGQKLNEEVKIIDGRSLIPLRAVGEALGLEVKWYSQTQVIEIKEPGDMVAFSFIDIPKNTFEAVVKPSHENKRFDLTLTGSEWHMHVKPANINGRVYVPVRLVASTFGAPVSVNNNVISVGKKFTDTGYSVKNISNLIYSENNVLAIPEEANQTTSTPTTPTTAPTQTGSTTTATSPQPTNNNAFDSIQVGLTEDGVTITEKVNQESKGLLNLVYLSINGRKVQVSEGDFFYIRNAYGMKGFKTFYDEAMFRLSLKLVDPVSALFDSDIPNVGKYARISVFEDTGSISVSGAVYASNRMGGKLLQTYTTSFTLDGKFKYSDIF